MISVESLFYKIDQKLNRLASNLHQGISEEDKTLAINEAQLKLIKQKLDGNNAYRLGLDSFKKRYQDLAKLIEEHDGHPLTLKLADPNLNRYSASTSALTPKYMFYIDSYILADKGQCTGRIVYVNNDFAKHADVTVLLNNSNYKPSFEFQETFSTSSSDELSFFSDGTFIPVTAYVSYMRYPAYVTLGNFELPDGTIIVPKQDSELDDYLEDELVDLTVKDLGSYIENQTAVQSSMMRMADNE